MDWLKAIYEVFGTPHPRASLLVVTIIGAAVAFGMWSFAAKQFEKDHNASNAPSQVSGPASTTGDKSPAVTGNGNDTHYDQAPNPERKPPPTSSPRTGSQAAIESSADDGRSASLTLEYDSLKERYSAVNQSLQQRASDLGNLPVKPEITTALGTAKADLAAADRAIKQRNWNVATERMEGVQKTLNYLESL